MLEKLKAVWVWIVAVVAVLLWWFHDTISEEKLVKKILDTGKDLDVLKKKQTEVDSTAASAVDNYERVRAEYLRGAYQSFGLSDNQPKSADRSPGPGADPDPKDPGSPNEGN